MCDDCTVSMCHCCAPPTPGSQPAGADSSGPSPVPPPATLGRGEGSTGGVLGDGQERSDSCLSNRPRRVLLFKTLHPLYRLPAVPA